MIQRIKDYAKCIKENKITLTGYLGLGTIILMNYVENQTGAQLQELKDFALYINAVTLAASELGLKTYKTYRKTKKHIQQYGHIDERFQEKYLQSYCTEIGLNLAKKEFYQK